MTTINPKQRTIARENILKVLYQQNLNEYAFSDILKTFIEKRKYDKDYFENIQNKETTYRPMISKDDPPAIYLNKDIMSQYKGQIKEFYFDETKYDNYLDQLGIKYPVIKDDN